MRKVRKTIREWEQDRGIRILEDGQSEGNHSILANRVLTQEEFDGIVAQRMRQQTKKQKDNPTPQNKGRFKHKLFVVLLVLFTMPALATLALRLICKGLARLLRFRWYLPTAILAGDLVILLLQPVTPVLSGPGYVWYQLAGFLYHQSSRGLALGRVLMLHQSYNLMGTVQPFLSSVVLNGSSLDLYFTLPQAITSSIVWATAIVSIRSLLKRRTSNPRTVTNG